MPPQVGYSSPECNYDKGAAEFADDETIDVEVESAALYKKVKKDAAKMKMPDEMTRKKDGRWRRLAKDCMEEG